jgi:hypothetical protein
LLLSGSYGRVTDGLGRTDCDLMLNSGILSYHTICMYLYAVFPILHK